LAAAFLGILATKAIASDGDTMHAGRPENFAAILIYR
jgi:hypothetical protein